MPHDKAALSINNICKSFKGGCVLNNISLEIKEGEIFGLVGLNGIGKTTLIKIILNLLNSDKGRVSFFDQDNKDHNSRKNICYLPEKFQPSLNLKGNEFLQITLSFFEKKFNLNLAKEQARLVDFDKDAIIRKISTYSKGMGQKLGLLSCFLSEAPLLILDEPMSGLDPKSRISVKDALIEYAAHNNTVFFSSHVLSDVDEICSRIAVLHDTKIIFLGSPKDLRDQMSSDSLEKAFLKLITKF